MKTVYMWTRDALGNISTEYTDNIVLTPPTASIEYSMTGRTNQDVYATVTGFSEPVTGLNATGHVFTGNGLFTFIFYDLR
jgi:hypothetical protein